MSGIQTGFNTTAFQRIGLEEELNDSLSALEVLEKDRAEGRIDDEEYAALYSEATARAAAAIRAVQDEGTEPRLTQPHVTDPSGTEPGPKKKREWLLVVGVLFLVGALGIVVGFYATSRLPGQTISGSQQLSAQQKLAEELVQGRILVSQGRDSTALRLFGQILATDPSQPEALAYQGWLLASAGKATQNRGLIERGRSSISRAIQADPAYPDAHLFLGQILYQDEHDLSDAVIQMRLFLLNRPSSALLQRSAPIVDGVFHAAGLELPLPTSPIGSPKGHR